MADPTPPQTLLSRCSADFNSPEFEFMVLRNPSFPQPDLLSADELFSDGFLVPLHLLIEKGSDPDGIYKQSEQPQPENPEPAGPEISVTGSESRSVSKRWKDIFKKRSVAGAEQGKEKEKQRKRGKKSQLGASSAAELNIHLWPFSRSRSAGNSGARADSASAAGGRKVSSAPCSRSNSAGESKSPKWANSTSRTGVHLGRSSPVWQYRRTASGRKNPVQEHTGRRRKANVLKLNVPMCIGYRNNCRSHENSAASVIGSDGGNSGNVNIFNLRNLFTKKVY